MEIKATLSNIRVAPRKARLVVDLVRNKNINDARNLLQFTVNKTSALLLKQLNSAIASAVNDFKLKEENLFISKIIVNEGPKMKRSFPMSRGRAYPIIKRTSQIILTLDELKKADNNKKDKESNKKEVKEVKSKKRVKSVI